MSRICRGVRKDLLFSFVIGGLFAIGTAHLVLLIVHCSQCEWVCMDGLFKGVTVLYRWALLICPMVLALLAALWLWSQRAEDDWNRVRHAIAFLGLLAVAVSYTSAFHWDWLNGSEAPSATVRNVGIAIAAILTLIFVVWRERIASARNVIEKCTASSRDRIAKAKNDIERHTASSNGYQRATEMLTNTSLMIRIGGIRLLQELGRHDPEYRGLCIQLLTDFENRFSTRAVRPSPARADLVAARTAIAYLRSLV